MKEAETDNEGCLRSGSNDAPLRKTDDQQFVVPRRAHGEAARTYIVRIDEATERPRHHPRRPD